MLQKLMLKVKCLKPGHLRGNGGTEIHGLFFHWLKTLDSQLSAKTHQQTEKPFVIGPIVGGTRKMGRTALVQGADYTFTLASLSSEMFNILQKIYREMNGTQVRLGNGELIVSEITPIYGEKGITYFDLLEKVYISPEIELEFCSPTSFRQQGTQELFPQPNLVFGSLLRKWNSFSPVLLSDELLNAKIYTSKYRLKTELVDFGNYKIVGCIGNCTYQIAKDQPSHIRKMLHTLAAFANIAAVGYKTSMGLGATSYKAKRR